MSPVSTDDVHNSEKTNAMLLPLRTEDGSGVRQWNTDAEGNDFEKARCNESHTNSEN